MIIGPYNDIIKLEKHPELETENFMNSLSYFSNFVRFILAMGDVVDIKKITFLPSYISEGVASKIGTNVTPEVYELRCINIKMDEFSVEIKEKIEERMTSICEDIRYSKDKTITFILI